MRYQVITWTWDEGHDERREFSTLAQARAAARFYRRESVTAWGYMISGWGSFGRRSGTSGRYDFNLSKVFALLF